MINKSINKRYKKLKQPDRMEYLSINSIYENRGNTYTKICLVLVGIKIFVFYLLLSILLSIAKLKGIENLSVNNLVQEGLKINLGEFVGMAFFIFLILIVEIMMLRFLYLNTKEKNKILEEFLSEREV